VESLKKTYKYTVRPKHWSLFNILSVFTARRHSLLCRALY